jgi:hypothetical protein
MQVAGRRLSNFKGMRDGKEENRQIYTGFTGKT